MKKPVKILLVTVLTLIGLYGIRMLYGLFIFYNAPIDHRLKVIESLYTDCVLYNNRGCEDQLVKDVKKILGGKKDEITQTILDKTKSEQERITALDAFFALSRAENAEMSKEEIDFYYYLVFDKENPFELGKTAYLYLLNKPIDDPKIIQMQMQVLNDPDASAHYKEMAIMALAQTGVSDVIDLFVDILSNEDSAPRIRASEALVDLGATDKIFDILEIALNENNPVPNRVIALSTIQQMIYRYGREISSPKLVEKLESLVDNDSFPIKEVSTEILSILTGKNYGQSEILTEEEIQEYVENKYLKNILIPGINY